jgi:hypothetical protein
VAPVKPAVPIDFSAATAGKMRIGMTIDAARAEFRYLSQADLVRMAYRVKSYQVAGPDWIKTERHDIVAKLPEGASRDQVPEMLQSLLADRFKLTLHREQKEHAVYALVVGKGGLKLKEAGPDPTLCTSDSPSSGGATGGELRVGSTNQVTTTGGRSSVETRISIQFGRRLRRDELGRRASRRCNEPARQWRSGTIQPTRRDIGKPSIPVGGAPARVICSGLTPGSAGLYQVNAEVPDRVPKGPAMSLSLTIGGAASKTVTVAVK